MIQAIFKSKMQAAAIPALLLLMLMFGCDRVPTEVEDYVAEPMLTAFLYNGEPADTVMLERVAPLYGYYDPADHVIPGADIKIIRQNDQAEFIFTDPDSDGVYTPDGNVLVPAGGEQFSIEARKDDEGLFLWAETMIPDTFAMAITPAPIDTVDGFPILDTLTRADPNIVLNWTDPGNYAGYVLNVICEDSTFVPLDPDFSFHGDEDSSRVSFDVIMEGFNMDIIPWIHFNWAGWHRVELLAVDDGYFNYFFSVFRMMMGQVTELEYNVQGGLGIFAGLSERSFRVYIEPVE
ncbi:hypothetical protein CEE37_09325 [candidate division LCP-89 bacterium B3_LCP]|uniref:DUF4249 family protein n=1 Tax=candidate division LCP-89 bacterium B3_LCP TaxID=2012998 RepID=A0A532UYA4_UNCL8|nr:MAG: hypothetical protein CEE37_09325 [candidate division LCP-89 bacterium B3_LCP]